MKFLALLALLLAGAIAMGAPGSLAAAAVTSKGEGEGTLARRRLAAFDLCTDNALFECCCDSDDADNDGDDTDVDCSCICPETCPPGTARGPNVGTDFDTDDDGDRRRRLAASDLCTDNALFECCCDGDDTDNDGDDTDADCSCICPETCPPGTARARNFVDFDTDSDFDTDDD